VSNGIICFSHGKESGPWGTKIKRLADLAKTAGWQVESLDYQGMDDPHARVDKLIAWCAQQSEPLVLAGSSMGGHVALAAAAEVTPRAVFVMAPAVYVSGYEQWTPKSPDCPVTIVHGWHDDVIPWQNSLRFAEEGNATLTLLNDDHRLIDQLDDVARCFSAFLDKL